MNNNVQLPQDPARAIGANVTGTTSPEDELLDFAKARTKFQQLVDSWSTEVGQTAKNRITRDLEFSVKSLRDDGTLDEDETIIPVRVIDTNIQRELPPYINYIKNSRRISTFRSLSNPGSNSDNIEQEFTSGMTYTGWENSHFKVLDGSCTHGWDANEVVFDASKPLHVAIEHVGHDRLFWPRTVTKLEQAMYVIRAYDYSPSELKQFVTKFGWDNDEVQKLIDAKKNTSESVDTTRVFKGLYKRPVDGVIMVGWFALDKGCANYLKAPVQLYLGIDRKTSLPDGTVKWEPVPITQYPFNLLPYRESEKPNLVDRKGRAFLDGNKQEAQTGLLSSFINGCARASTLKASPKQDDGTGNSVNSDDVKNIGGTTIIPQPMDYFYLPWPDTDVLKSLQYLDTQTATETNQVNFAVNNRQDSRKTAKEIETATQQASLLNSVQLTLFSTYFRATYAFAWLIVQSQALQGLIKFLQIPQPSQNPQLPPTFVNDIQTISQVYELRAAGDVDVVQRQELLAQMKQDWAVFQNTGCAQVFLEDLIRLSYPASADKYIGAINSGQQQQMQQIQQNQQQAQALIKGLGTALEGVLKDAPDVVKNLPPDQQQHLMQMIQAANQVPAPAQSQGGQQ